MTFLKKYIAPLYLSTGWYLWLMGLVILFIVSYFIPILFPIAQLSFFIWLAISVADYLLLWRSKPIKVLRSVPSRLSLGDDNPITLQLKNPNSYLLKALLIEETPHQLQWRDFETHLTLPAGKNQPYLYNVKPKERGVYHFGHTHLFISTRIGFLQKRQIVRNEERTKTYPAFLHLKKFQIIGNADQLPVGLKKIRKIGHSMEFEQIREYVSGDDIRTINWKATARKADLMVNAYTDLKQQQVYLMIDKGRAMKMPFDGLTLLDHAINSALALANVVLLKQDKVGLITFSRQVDDLVAAERKRNQLSLIMDTLYKVETDFQENDYERLWVTLHRKINHRSFFILYTNFETMSALSRQLPMLKKMAERHLVCVVFFENTLLKQLYESYPNDTEGVYIKTIADRFQFEKKQIVKELARHGLIPILTTPHNLSVAVINKYVELKARQMI